MLKEDIEKIKVGDTIYISYDYIKEIKKVKVTNICKDRGECGGGHFCFDYTRENGNGVYFSADIFTNEEEALEFHKKARKRYILSDIERKNEKVKEIEKEIVSIKDEIIRDKRELFDILNN